MIWLEKMDLVLQCLYDHSGENPRFTDLQEWLKNKDIEKGEIQDITLYLYREQMMYLEFGGDRTQKYFENIDSRYLISCKGKLFWEGIGGFDKQNQNRLKELKEVNDRNQRMERNEESLVTWTQNLTNRTSDLTFWTRLVAIGAIGLVAWEIIAFFLEHC